MTMHHKSHSQVAAIILAAGAATRMGQPKQLLEYAGTSLIEHTIKSAMASPCSPVIVVLGANSQLIQPHLNYPSVKIIENKQWHLGMGSSVRTGMEFLSQFPHIDAVMMMVCDQPFISPEVIQRILDAYDSSQKPIIASAYAQTYGVPALFAKELFPQLTGLSDTQGAKQLIKTNLDKTTCIPFPLGKIDIDTPAEYQQLTRLEVGFLTR